jgi:PAS domain S-box-containing protein
MNTRVELARDEAAPGVLVQTLEQAIDAVVVVDAQGLVVFFNAAAERFWGCSRIEALGGNVSALIPRGLTRTLTILPASTRTGRPSPGRRQHRIRGSCARMVRSAGA